MRNSAHRPVSQTGIWIDHSRAIVVEIAADDTVHTRTLKSDLERTTKPQGGAHGGIGEHVVTGANLRRLAERRRNALRTFYRSVWGALPSEGDLVVLGPSLAPKELIRNAPRHGNTAARLRAILRLGTVTDGELLARVREFFGRDAPRRQAMAH
ncbi:MAG: hypothetical protein KC591_05420 [Gemmatimonadetes bacterium]|nr:hypothetical protein [Gemmatimonadota bacterium]